MRELGRAERHGRLFHRISLPYSWFFGGQLRTYAGCFETGRRLLPDPKGKRALDLGCGTGAFTRALLREGWEALGVDMAPGMLVRARGRGLPCAPGDGLAGLPYEDASFDLVTAAYVAHGLEREDRRRLFLEMKRLSRDLVLIHDYTADRSFFVTVIEYLEGGGYFDFILGAEEELREVFPKVEVHRVGKQAAWYLCSAR